MSNKHLMSLSQAVPEYVQRIAVGIPDATRGSGIRVVGSRGSGKSRLVGRLLCFQDFLRGLPQLILDPLGGTASNFLDKVSRLPRAQQQALWPRITWIDMGGEPGLDRYVIPLPLLYQWRGESFYEQSQRYTNVIRRFDPHLLTASIQGWNSFHPLASSTGALLAAMGYQYTEALDMVNHPEHWEGAIRHVAAAHPWELGGLASFLLDDIAQAGRDKQTRTSAFLTKLRQLFWNPYARAMFGASVPGISWPTMMRERQTIIFDFRNEHDAELRRFKLLWVFGQIMEFIYSRPTNPTQAPVGLVIDEIRYMLGDASQPSDDLQKDLDELVNQQMRNKAVWVTILHQELNQLSPVVRDILMTMGVQAFGGTSDPEAALTVAKRYHDWDPTLVKKREPIYVTTMGATEVIDYKTTEYSIEEQEYLHSRAHLKLPRYRYLVSVAPDEGSQPLGLQEMSIAPLDAGQYVREEVDAAIRQRLMARDGRVVREVLAAIAQRRPHLPPVSLPEGAQTAAIGQEEPRFKRRQLKATDA